MKIHLRHVRSAHGCLRGCRRWARRHGLSAQDMRDGVDADKLRAIGDPLALAVIAAAELEVEHTDG